MQTIKYRVENASISTITEAVQHNGRPATVSYDQALIEALPVDGGPTFAFQLPPEALAEFPEGATITVSIEATETPVPATEAAPAQTDGVTV